MFTSIADGSGRVTAYALAQWRHQRSEFRLGGEQRVAICQLPEYLGIGIDVRLKQASLGFGAAEIFESFVDTNTANDVLGTWPVFVDSHHQRKHTG